MRWRGQRVQRRAAYCTAAKPATTAAWSGAHTRPAGFGAGHPAAAAVTLRTVHSRLISTTAGAAPRLIRAGVDTAPTATA